MKRLPHWCPNPLACTLVATLSHAVLMVVPCRAAGAHNEGQAQRLAPAGIARQSQAQGTATHTLGQPEHARSTKHLPTRKKAQ